MLRRKRGTLERDRDNLRWRYDNATRGRQTIANKNVVARDEDPLFNATGDPLVKTDPLLAASVYGLTGAARPRIALRRIAGRVWGNSLTSVIDMAVWFARFRGWSALRSAGEAVALAAERGVWIGAKAPVSFDKAVDLVRRGIRQKKDGPAALVGATGRQIYVKPGADLTVRRPTPPYQPIPVEGAFVPDCLYWRRRIACGDAIDAGMPLEKKDQL